MTRLQLYQILYFTFGTCFKNANLYLSTHCMVFSMNEYFIGSKLFILEKLLLLVTSEN